MTVVVTDVETVTMLVETGVGAVVVVACAVLVLVMVLTISTLLRVSDNFDVTTAKAGRPSTYLVARKSRSRDRVQVYTLAPSDQVKPCYKPTQPARRVCPAVRSVVPQVIFC